jgi:hypothetical protein
MPRIQYRDSKGNRLPGVTTVENNIGWNKRVLMIWANNCGLDGQNHDDVASYEGTIGSVAHAMLEAELKKEQFDLALLDLEPDQVAAVGRCMQGWREFKETIRIAIAKGEDGRALSEISLVSDTYKYGGTIDAIVVRETDETRYGLLDFKTGSGIYAEALIQVTAYAHLWNEYHPDKQIQDLYILRLGKNDGGFTWKWIPWSQTEVLWNAFKAALLLHEYHKVIRKMA